MRPGRVHRQGATVTTYNVQAVARQSGRQASEKVKKAGSLRGKTDMERPYQNRTRHPNAKPADRRMDPHGRHAAESAPS